MIDWTVPSMSEAVKEAVTVCPMPAGFGVTEFIASVGALSLMVSIVLAWPDPPGFVAVTVIVKFSDLKLPVVE